MQRVLLPVLLLAACGGSSRPVPAPAPAPMSPASAPELLGRPIWDGPLPGAEVTRLLDQVRATLEVPVPLLEGRVSSDWGTRLKAWLEERVAAGREIRAEAERLPERDDPRVQLLAAIAVSVAADDLIGDLAAIQLPAAVRDGDHGADIEKVFRESLEDLAVPLVKSARTSFERCRALAPSAPAVLQPWAEYCGERATSLAQIEERAGERVASKPPPKPAAKPPAVLGDCETTEPLRWAPNALPPDRTVKPAIAFIYTGDAIQDAAEIAKLEAAVATKLGKDTGMPVVSGKELAAARKLVAQRKLHARGPSCGQAPPLTAVVAHQRKHLVIGEITATCIHSSVRDLKPVRCELTVQYRRAGDSDHTGLPRQMSAPLGSSRDVPASDYLAAVERLAPEVAGASIFGALSGSGGAKVFLRYSGHADEDPWLRVPGTLRDETAARLEACVDAAASFDASFTITREGTTKDVVLAPVTAPPADSKVADCVKQALAATPWPCTRDGKPAKVEVRMCIAPKP